jgi:hypothetical protein
MVNLATTKHILRKITMRMQCDEANATNLIKDTGVSASRYANIMGGPVRALGPDLVVGGPMWNDMPS